MKGKQTFYSLLSNKNTSISIYKTCFFNKLYEIKGKNNRNNVNTVKLSQLIGIGPLGRNVNVLL